MNNQDNGIELIQQYLQVQNTDEGPLYCIYLNEHDITTNITVKDFIKSTPRMQYLIQHIQ